MSQVSLSSCLMSLVVPEELHQETEPWRGLVLGIGLLVQTQHLLANLEIAMFIWVLDIVTLRPNLFFKM